MKEEISRTKVEFIIQAPCSNPGEWFDHASYDTAKLAKETAKRWNGKNKYFRVIRRTSTIRELAL